MNPSSDPIQELIARLRGAHIGADYRQLEEILWLSRVLPAGEKRDALEPIAMTSPVTPPPAIPPSQIFAPEEFKPATIESEAAGAPVTKIYAGTDASDSEETFAASRIRAPGTAALPGGLEIGRALRPFLRRVKSTRVTTFDEEATVERSAETRAFTPVFGPGRERWFDVALVVEDNSPMILWQQTIREFRQLLEHHGAFRDVRLWRLRIEASGAQLVTGAGSLRPPAMIKDPAGRRLICFLTNGVSVAWRDGMIERTLLDWAGSGPVAIIQVHGQRLWHQTFIGEPSAEVRGLMPGLPNRLLEATVEWYEEKSTERIAFPIFTLEPQPIGAWARAVMATGGACQAALLPLPARAIKVPGPFPVAAERLVAFGKLVSETAYQLAIYLSIVPLQFPVMRLVQRVMLPESRIEHLSEVLLGGIVKRNSLPGEAVADDEIQFDFVDEEIRARLQSEISRPDLLRVLDEVSAYVRQHIDASFDFRAYVPDPEGEEQISSRALPFARIATEALGRFGIVTRRRVPPEVLDRRRQLAIFLAHAEADRTAVAELLRRLKDAGFSPWRFFVEKTDAPESEIEAQIIEAVELCDVFVPCLTPHYGALEPGKPVIPPEPRLYVAHHAALRAATRSGLDILPLRLIECPLPMDFDQLKSIDLYQAQGWSDLVARLDQQAARKAEKSSITKTESEIDALIEGLVGDAADRAFRALIHHPDAAAPGKLRRALVDPARIGIVAQVLIERAVGGDQRSFNALRGAVLEDSDEIRDHLFRILKRRDDHESQNILRDLVQQHIQLGDPYKSDESYRKLIETLDIPGSEWAAEILLKLAAKSEESVPYRILAAEALARTRIASVLPDLARLMPATLGQGQLCLTLIRAYAEIGGGLSALEDLRRTVFYDHSETQYQRLLPEIDRVMREIEFGQQGLLIHDFTVVKLDEYGKEAQRYERSAGYFEDDLGEGVTIKMIAIPGGEFLMGSLPEEEQSYDDERPQHRVSVPSFFMGMHQVTQAQWRAVAKMKRIERDLKPEPSNFKGDDRPVEQVSWDDAKEFCRRLSNFSGKAYRLPSEAEWEYACRAETTTPFHFGPTVTPDFVNYDGNYPYGNAPKGDYREETTPAGYFQVANDFGLYDMHGNVLEWCEDEWHDNYDSQHRPGDGSPWVSTKPEIKQEGLIEKVSKRIRRKPDSDDVKNLHVLRGGSWINYSNNCRSARRDYYRFDVISNLIGFRVVVSSRNS